MSFSQKVLPIPGDDSAPSSDPALELIRSKVSALYINEPSAQEEEAEIEAVGAHSKHQRFMRELMSSGADMAVIQTKWHEYYQTLSDDDKKEVWQEFYANHERTSHYAAATKAHTIQQAKTIAKIHQNLPQNPTQTSVIGEIDDVREEKPKLETTKKNVAKPKKTVADLKNHVLSNVQSQRKLSKKHHFQSLLFGLGMGTVVMVIFMFGFFNQQIIAPFITPSRSVSNTPIIVDPAQSSNVGPDSKILIPKINVEVPVVYDVKTINEKQIQAGLENGVVHYPTTPNPGQNGNIAIVGHSSNNIFNKGKYKFAFVALSKLEVGDTFMLHYGGTRYVYKIYEKRIVKPTDVSVLGPKDRPATATLITCDPPGTALNRLIVVGEQISPEPGKNVAAAPVTNQNEQPAIVPGNAQSLFQRLFGWL